jgi:hypothetical protein
LRDRGRVKSALRRSTGIAGVVLATAAAMPACGARTSLSQDTSPTLPTDGGGGADSCAVAPSCANNTRGTWLLETDAHVPLGWLFTFDGSQECNESPTAFEIVLTGPGQCSRDGAITIQTNDASSFDFSTDNLGGSDSAECGATDPSLESMEVRLERRPCDSVTYDFVVTDARKGTPWNFASNAVRCRCDIAWRACVDGLPDDPCAP